jgi:hypothetical protein
MELSGKREAAERAYDPDYLEAHRLYQEAVLDSQHLARQFDAAKERKKYSWKRRDAAAESYCKRLEDEISVAPACKCKCEGEQ